MLSQENGDGQRRRELMLAACDSNPFMPVINRFYKGSRELSPQDLDEINLALTQLPELTKLYETLTEQPRFTGVFRYDPQSIKFMGSEGCFSSRTPMGAATAYGRIFEGLTIDKVQTIHAGDEVMVVIAQPSYLISSRKAPIVDNNPTVLFSSKMFEGSMLADFQQEEHQLGVVIKHGDTPFSVKPFSNVTTPEMELSYLRYAAQYEKSLDR